MEGRMTICNMSVEGGAQRRLHRAGREDLRISRRAGPKAPKGDAWDQAVRYWETLRTDDGAFFDREVRLDAAKLPPLVTWGTSPEQVIVDHRPRAGAVRDRRRAQARRGRRVRWNTWA